MFTLENSLKILTRLLKVTSFRKPRGTERPNRSGYCMRGWNIPFIQVHIQAHQNLKAEFGIRIRIDIAFVDPDSDPYQKNCQKYFRLTVINILQIDFRILSYGHT